MTEDFDSLFREAMVNLFSHSQYLKRRGFKLDVELKARGKEVIISRRDDAIVLRVPLEVLKDRFGLSKLGF